MVSSTNTTVFTLHNKILLWRESTSIYFPLQGLYKFSLKFLFNSGVIVFWLLPISLIDFHPLCCMIKHLLSFYFTRHQIILISKSLGAYALLLPLLTIEISFLQEQKGVYSLVILLMSKGINFLILTLILFLFQEMLCFMSLYFLTLHLHVVLLPQHPCVYLVLLLFLSCLMIIFCPSLLLLLFLLTLLFNFITALMMIFLMRCQ